MKLSAPAAPFAPLDANVYRQSLEDTLRQTRRTGALAVFAYASLVWRPCFPSASTVSATLNGFKRCFCVWTVQARGTVAHPGLGLGLVASHDICQGHLLTVAPEHFTSALAAMWEREMLTGVYQPVWLPVHTPAGSERALTFCIDTTHPQFAGVLPTEEQARLIANAAGQLGTNRQYLDETVASLREYGLTDPDLETLARAVRALAPGNR